MNWNDRCLKSIRKERLEVEKKYNIKIGLTDIRCASCGRSWGFGGHVCSKGEIINSSSKAPDQEILRLRDEGKSCREIGALLGVSHTTVLKKLGGNPKTPLSQAELVV